ncbi:AraC family transcriptional regulator [Jiangella asiatica]|uniref:AraC family transcriptional regulator n=1 Tax=Jiangella asiatica TaxID=2530372 RepID=A0A4R5DL48_9ACTN|nr:AraC family transcriptional regulator [Jiangella asiatica]TDE14936.1 AraC family transcriptional regulator [Jiangella asiatica]
MDALANLLDGVRARSAAFCRAVLEPPWALRIADRAPLALAAAVHGHAWIVPDDAEPLLMRTGDVVVIKGPHPYTVSDHPETEPSLTLHAGNRLTDADGRDVTGELNLGPNTYGHGADGSAVVASGTYQVTGDVGARLLSALPPLVHVPRADARIPILTMLEQEVAADEPGQRAVLDRLLDLTLIATLRAWFARPDAAAPGWYRAHSDPLVGPALELIHDDPARPWTVARLAAATGASRAAFARRFTDLVGEPPMTYLTGWRITLAADLLRGTDTTIDAIARRVGYANAFALSVAFKRVRGITPRQHRGQEAGADDGPGQLRLAGTARGRTL